MNTAIPEKWGGLGLSCVDGAIISEEFARARAPGELRGIGPSMLVPTLIECGEEWQKEKFVSPTIKGDIHWCQGYSEPGSGSDLASLRTRAELVGDEWVITGQKIWTTGAHLADWMFCLCRTEPEASKHAGISYLLIDMKQPGIEVRPLRMMSGSADFNEVFFNDVRTPSDWIVGGRGEGWKVSRTTLKHERNSIGSAALVRGQFQSLVELARESGRLGDSAIRQRLAEIEGAVLAHEYSGYRQLSADVHGTQAGIIGLTRSIARETSRYGITCNAICPGWIETGMQQAGFDLADNPQAARDDALARHAAHRFGQPQDVASLALWLASDAASFVTGQCYTIDGGLTAASPLNPGLF